MKKIKIYLALAIIQSFITPAYANEPEFKWVGEIYMKEDSHIGAYYLSINSNIVEPNMGSYSSAREEKFQLKISCNLDAFSIGPAQEIEFPAGYDISLSSNSDMRIEANTISDKDLIDKIINSPYINIYSRYSRNKIGIIKFEKLREFIKKNNKRISECKNKRRQDEIKEQEEIAKKIEKKNKENLILKSAIIISSLLGLLITINLISKIVKRTKNTKKDSEKENPEITNENFEKEIERKKIQIAYDEIVKQTVKRAMSHGINPEDIILCPKCKGAGCDLCSHKGWSE